MVAYYTLPDTNRDWSQLTLKLHLTPAMQAYAHQNLSNAGFGFDNNQSSGMKTCRDAGYITACKGDAGELLLPTCLHELN